MTDKSFDRDSSPINDLHPGVHSNEGLGHYATRMAAIEALLVEKGIIGSNDVKDAAEEIDSRSPADGARVVARAWVDPEFKRRLLQNPKSAIAELGYTITTEMPQLVVVENTEEIHHLVVCTLCSCYPRSLLGRPPQWYKSLAYRSHAVVEPREVMREFGLDLDVRVEVRVLDSTADMRFLVLPRRPAGTEGMSEDELARLVTRDSMIGVTHPHSPKVSTAL